MALSLCQVWQAAPQGCRGAWLHCPWEGCRVWGRFPSPRLPTQESLQITEGCVNSPSTGQALRPRQQDTPVQVTTQTCPPPKQLTRSSRTWREQWKTLDLSTKAALWVWRK